MTQLSPVTIVCSTSLGQKSDKSTRKKKSEDNNETNNQQENTIFYKNLILFLNKNDKNLKINKQVKEKFLSLCK